MRRQPDGQNETDKHRGGLCVPNREKQSTSSGSIGCKKHEQVLSIISKRREYSDCGEKGSFMKNNINIIVSIAPFALYEDDREEFKRYILKNKIDTLAHGHYEIL